MKNGAAPVWQDLMGRSVVIDTSSPYVYLGRLVDRQGDFLVLQDVDAHDLRDTQTTREKYVLDARQLGITPNRHWTWVSMREVVAISRLEDVLAYE